MLLESLVIPIRFDTGLLLEGIHAVEGLITGAIDRTSKWAGELHNLSDITGMEGDTLAAWTFVSDKAGVSVDLFSRATVILEKGLIKADGTLDTTGKQLADFGVNVYDVNGKVKDQSVLMNDIARRYATFGTQTEKVNFLTGIFGRSGAQLIDVFDTLAKSGGIDAVKEKVAKLGLVLDPAQYEQFQRNLNEIGLTITGLANAFVGPLLPGAEKIIGLFKDWLQSPWVADQIKNIGDQLSHILIPSLIDATGKLINFVQTGVANFEQFKETSKTETTAIGRDWNTLLATLSTLLNDTFGTKGINLVINWSQIGQTALQVVDIAIISLTAAFHMVSAIISAMGIQIKMWTSSFMAGINTVIGGVKNLISWINNINPPSFNPFNATVPKGQNANIRRKALGGFGSGMTWVGERGPELVDLPGGSFVNSNSASQGQGFDYYKFASILAVEFAKARD